MFRLLGSLTLASVKLGLVVFAATAAYHSVGAALREAGGEPADRLLQYLHTRARFEAANLEHLAGLTMQKISAHTNGLGAAGPLAELRKIRLTSTAHEDSDTRRYHP